MENLIKVDFRKSEDEETLDRRVNIVYYNDLGFSHAGENKGSMVSYKMHVSKLYYGYVEKNKRLKHKTDEDDKQLELEISRLSSDIKTLQTSTDSLKNNDIKQIEKKVADIKEEIRTIKDDPKNNIHIEKPDKFSFYLGLVLLAFLTIYLWVFYSSAIYSAVFREINFTKNVVFNSVFYANSFAESLRIGIAAFILISVAPFIFLALGYLVHKFLEMKRVIGYIFLFGLLILTFFFDSIIAYEITKKIYEATALNSFTEFEPYNLSMAFNDINFWLIIFAGFIVYIVWGTILFFVSHGYKNLDAVSSAVKKRLDQIKLLDEDKAKLEKEIEENKKNIAIKEGEIETKTKSLGVLPFNLKEFEKILSEFGSGWLKYKINANHPDPELEALRDFTHTYLYNLASQLIVKKS